MYLTTSFSGNNVFHHLQLIISKGINIKHIVSSYIEYKCLYNLQYEIQLRGVGHHKRGQSSLLMTFSDIFKNQIKCN